MLRTTLKAFFLSLIISTQIQAQSWSESIFLDWDKDLRYYQLNENAGFSYLHFKDAIYHPSTEQVPVFSKNIRLNTYGTINARLVNEQYTPIANTADLDLTMIGHQIDIQTAVSFQRKKPVGLVNFIPIRKNPSTGVYEQLLSADLQVSVTPKTNPYAGGTARNYTTNSKFSDGQLYKIAVTKTGIHKIDYTFLKNLGIDVDQINPRNIQLLGNGGRPLAERMDVPIADDVQENAILVAGENDGSFDQNDYMLFYAVGPRNWIYNNQATCGKFSHETNPYTDESYYFIKIGNSQGKRIGSQANLGSATYNTTSYDALAHHEVDELNLMEADFSLPPSGRVWYGESFRITRSRDFNFTFDNRIESEPISIQSDLAARVFSPGNATMSVNNIDLTPTPASQALSLTSSNSYALYATHWRVPCSPTLVTGQDISIQINLNHLSSSAELWLNYLTVNARCALNFKGSQMNFRDSRSIGQGSAQYSLNNANNISIWDVSNPFEVKSQDYTSNNNTAVFATNANTLHEFVAFDNSAFLQPIDRGTVANQNLHAMTTPPEAIFVTHSSLRSEAERLATHRRSVNNMTVEVVEIDDIYHEFSSGNPDVTAIRDFCRMLYERETASHPFTHVLLFGIGSFDYKSLGANRTPENNPNLVPLYQSTESLHPILTYTSDDYFALLDTMETIAAFGGLDIAVGRLPAANINEATVFVNKIIDYETKSDFLTDWKNRLCFVADDGDTNGHFNDAEGVSTLAQQQDTTYNVDKVYLDAFKQVSTSAGERYPDAKNALLDALFKGSFIVNYLGHGADDGWTQERVFTNTDIKNLKNYTKPPLFITATCSFGPHDNPKIVSAAELLLLNPEGGAISMMTTVRVVTANENKQLVKHTFDAIFDKINGQYPTTGEVLQRAKTNYGTSDPINTRKYTLLGDPTMRLAYPKHYVKTQTINGVAITGQDTIKALQRVTITGDIVDENNVPVSTFNGIVYPTVFDKADRLYTLGNDPGDSPQPFMLRKKVIFKGQAKVENGHFSFSFVVPKDINYSFGDGKISYYAEDGTSIDASDHYSGLIVGGSYANAPIDNQGPDVLVYMNTAEFVRGGITDANPKILVNCYDENGINTVGNSIGHDLTAKLIHPDGSEEAYVLNDFYESNLNDYTTGSALYPLKDLAAGQYTVHVKAWDTYNNPGEGSTEFIVAESANMALDHVLNYPNPFTTNTDFQFEHNLPYQALEVQVQIYTVSGKLIKTIDHDISAEANTGYRVTGIHWNGLDDFGDRIGKGVYVYKIQVRAEGSNDQAKQNSKFQKLVILK